MSTFFDSYLPGLLVPITTPSDAPPSPMTPLSANDTELGNLLSIHASVPATPSPPPSDPSTQDQNAFKKIGAGACGAIFGADDKSFGVKLAKADDHTELWNDYVQHATIAKRFAAHRVTGVRIPEVYYFVPACDLHTMDQYQSLKSAAEGVVNLPTAALVSQRIPPLPKRTRALLIDKYCAPRIKSSALCDPANNDCLVRVYLGSMAGRANQMFFSLRNFKLHLNQMQEIQTEVEPIAQVIGEAMAVMHWAAKTDARDVEFVLGTSSDFRPMGRFDADELANLDPGTYTGPMSRVHQDFFGRKTELWILDFNQVRTIKMDKEGVAQAVQAATINDPYLPRPHGDSEVERRAWNTFVTSYLETSERVIRKEGMEDEVMQLPVMFLEGLIDVQRKKQEMTKERD